MPSTFNAQDAAAYERVMGRWSRRLAEPLLAFAGDLRDRNVLDVGCGTGSLTFALAERGSVASITAIDVAQAYVDFAKARNRDARVTIQCADACELPFEADRFDACVSLLALHLMSDPVRALREMVRVTVDGGAIVGAVWDVRGGLPHARMFLDTAATFDPAAQAMRARYMSVPLAQTGEMAALWHSLGLREVEQDMVTVRFEFEDFDDYWAPFLTGEGTMGGYIAGLAAAQRDALGARMRDAYQSGAPDGPRSFAASAWICRGIVSKSDAPVRQ